MTIPVFLTRLPDDDPVRLDRAVADLLDAAAFHPAPGTRILVKPNLVAPRRTHLSCTSPAVVRAVCRYLLEHGTRPVVGDSPAFGSARVVARISGLTRALADLGVPVINFSASRRVPLSFGGGIGVARAALETELIVNVPRLKVHDQMGMTVAVKNTFGCVVGSRKALAHQIHGGKDARFARLILEVMAALPPCFHLLDGITAMHRSGPAGGDPFRLWLLAASDSAVALDTAIYGLTGIGPELVPLWRAARDAGLPGARPGELAYPLLSPADFDVAGFCLPRRLSPVAFRPWRFVTGRVKSLLARFR